MRVKAVAALSLIAVGALADEPPEAEPVRLEVQPVRDVAIIGTSLGFAGILGLIDSTGEVHPQQVTPGFDIDKLLSIDRGAVTQTIDPNAGTYSDIALYTALGYALVDPILTGVRQQSVQAAILDAVIYAESLSLTLGLTNFAKISVRRPRPIAYIQARAHADDPTWMSTNTDSSASFFSGHASECAAVTATATYLAFLLELNKSMADAVPGLRSSSGMIVTAKADFTPAIDAGLAVGDVIRSINEFPSPRPTIFAQSTSGSETAIRSYSSWSGRAGTSSSHLTWSEE